MSAMVVVSKPHQKLLTAYPDSVEASPHVFVAVAVPGICTA